MVGLPIAGANRIEVVGTNIVPDDILEVHAAYFKGRVCLGSSRRVPLLGRMGEKVLQPPAAKFSVWGKNSS